MGILETIFISIGLAMDAFAVAICKGLSMKKMNWKNAFIIAIYFGLFQMSMPMIGYVLGYGYKVDFNTMVMLAIATSIDALAIGITYAFLDARNIMFSFVLIGVITFIISLIGVKIGNKFGDKYGKKAELIGGLILVFIGIKILLEHIVLN